MKKYIDEELLLQKLSRMIDYCKTDSNISGLTALFQVGDAIMDCPAEDVVEVVRCCDCVYYKPHNDRYGYCNCGDKECNYGAEFYPYISDFCSYAVKR